MTVGDHFPIDSVTKTMTAALVLQLVQRGKLGLNQPVSKYVGGVPLGRLITIRMLLDHTSGLQTGPGKRVQAKLQRDYRRGFSPERLIRGPVRAPRAGLPGQVWQYSNTGYFLLGMIIERVTQRPLPTLYRQRIFDRIGMDETRFRPRLPLSEPAAHGYVASTSGRPRAAPATSPTGIVGAVDGRRRLLNARGSAALGAGTGDGARPARSEDPGEAPSPLPTGLNGLFQGVGYGLGIFGWPLPPGTFHGATASCGAMTPRCSTPPC
jgi:D-alanyl-D-alanine carboxypeptidase